MKPCNCTKFSVGALPHSGQVWVNLGLGELLALRVGDVGGIAAAIREAACFADAADEAGGEGERQFSTVYLRLSATAGSGHVTLRVIDGGDVRVCTMHCLRLRYMLSWAAEVAEREAA